MSEPMYSDAERRMFTELGWEYVINNVEPIVLYRMAVHEAFVGGLCGIYADALRASAKAIDKCTPYRLTPEFDRLITQHIGDGVSSIGKVPPPRGPKIITDRPYLPG